MRAAAVDRRLGPSQSYGIYGTSKFLSGLSYTDANNLWVIPTAHTLLYGAFKDFWKFVLAPQKVGRVHLFFALGLSRQMILGTLIFTTNNLRHAELTSKRNDGHGFEASKPFHCLSFR